MKSIKCFLIWALFVPFCFDTLGQDTLNSPHNKFTSEDGKMVYQRGKSFRRELLRNSLDLGNRTNNIELLSQVNLVKHKAKRARNFGIASISSLIVATSIYGASGSQSLNSEQSLKVFFIGTIMLPPFYIFGITAIINNGQKKRSTIKLVTLYNSAL